MVNKAAIRICGKVLLLLAIPIFLVIRMGYDAILPLIIYLQLILIWAQAEISIRQLESFSFQFEPSFDIKETSLHFGFESPHTERHSEKYHTIKIKNIGKWPAYNVMVARLLDNRNRPVSPNSWPQSLTRNNIKCLAPEQESILFSFTERDRKYFIKEKITFEIIYFNRFGNTRSFFITFTETGPFIYHEPISSRGFLLKTFEEVVLLYKIYRHHIREKTR